MKIDLPDGAWADLRDPHEVTERQRRPLTRLQRRTAIRVAGSGVDVDNLAPDEFLSKIMPAMTDEDMDVLDTIDDHVIAVLVESWSFDLPVTPDGSLDLPPKARTVLLEECRKLLPALLGTTSDEDVLDPSSPTVPANDSGKP